jgi:hypothetical protein
LFKMNLKQSLLVQKAFGKMQEIGVFLFFRVPERVVLQISGRNQNSGRGSPNKKIKLWSGSSKNSHNLN